MKKVFRRVFQLIFHPATAWDRIAGEMEDGPHNVFADYFYPLVSYCALICFAVKLFSVWVADSTASYGEVIPQAFLEIVGFFFIFVGGFYATLYAMRYLLPQSWQGVWQGYPAGILIAYSMTLLIVLRTVGSMVEIFQFLGFAFQFYTLYIVWEGTKKVLPVPDKIRMTVSVLVTLVMILFTTLIARLYEGFIH